MKWLRIRFMVYAGLGGLIIGLLSHNLWVAAPLALLWGGLTAGLRLRIERDYESAHR